MQELKPLDHRKCRDFGEWAEKKIALDPVFKIEILFSDEAHFCVRLWGYVKSQVYPGKPQTLERQGTQDLSVIAGIRSQLLEKSV